ncbi:hypothetical protein NQ117_03055 [Paenibacillus sp. SC116]|nr:hypothetical protein [Paenibacillus sp. SC116]
MMTLIICLLVVVIAVLLLWNFNDKEKPTHIPEATTKVESAVTPQNVEIFAADEEMEPQVTIVDKVDKVWGEDPYIDGQTLLVIKNENSYPVRVNGLDVTYISVQGERQEVKMYSAIPSVLQPGETGYASSDATLSFIDFAEDFTGSEIDQDISRVENGHTYTKLEAFDIGFGVAPSDPGKIIVHGMLANNTDVNVDGDKIDVVAMLYDNNNKLIGGIDSTLNKSGERLRKGEQFDFEIENILSFPADLVTRAYRVDVYAGCEFCN